MKHCNKCGAEISKEDDFCPNCGKKLSKSEGNASPKIFFLVISGVLVIGVIVLAILLFQKTQDVEEEQPAPLEFIEETPAAEPICGDGFCNGMEGCLSCSKDCGKCQLGTYCNRDSDCDSGKCGYNKCVDCTDECDMQSYWVFCEGVGYFTCSDIDGDGCNEKEVVRYCGSDFRCDGNILCVSQTKDNTLKLVISKTNIENREGKPILAGSDFSDGAKTCTVLEIVSDKSNPPKDDAVISSCELK